MQFDYIVVIGRFQPIRNLHQARVRQALLLAPKVIVLVGSACRPRSARNPFSADERAAMLRSIFETERERLTIEPVGDRLYDQPRWVVQVRELIATIAASTDRISIGLIAAEESSTSYESMFPEWTLIEGDSVDDVTATELRDALFAEDSTVLARLRSAVPPAVFLALERFRRSSEFLPLAQEHHHLLEYKQSWACSPFPPIFVTADCVLVHSDHVLLIQRGHAPGKGLWALPGGFVDQQEFLLDAALRELKEETQLAVPANVLKQALVGREVFDYPERSARGRTITHAFYFRLNGDELPFVRGGDDAALAKWIKIDELAAMESQFFEDHFHILDFFVRASG